MNNKVDKELHNNVIEEVERGVERLYFYGCSYCATPDVFDTVDGVRKHLKTCIMNPMNDSCATCKNLSIIKDAPIDRCAKPKEDMQLKVALGSYSEGYCEKNKKKLKEKDYFEDKKCYEAREDNEEIPTFYTKTYREHMDILKEMMEDEEE